MKLGKLGRKLGLRFRELMYRIWTCDYGIVWIVLITLGVILGTALLVGLSVGLIFGIPALMLFLAWNWVIPVFGGPSISYWTAAGMVILVFFIERILHSIK